MRSVLIRCRAYIAASRRSDRSIEARVESARRASEIHKKRTGRSLRVTEKDVENEEMYEEEDDDLPMQYRRFSALHPGQPFTPFAERINNYMTSQVGMRNYLHEAIFQAKQTTAQHQHMNAMLLDQHQQHQQQQQQQQQNNHAGLMGSPSLASPSWPLNQMAQPEPTTIHTESFSHSPPPQQINSSSVSSPSSRRNASNASASLFAPGPSHAHQHAPQIRSPSGEDMSFDTTDPFSSTLPINQQQLLDGVPSFANGVHLSQMTPGVPMPSTYHYQFDPDSKANNNPGSQQFAFRPRDLSQTLAPQNMHNIHYAQTDSEPLGLDFEDMLAPRGDENALFGLDQDSNVLDGQTTPGGDLAYNLDDWLESDFNTGST